MIKTLGETLSKKRHQLGYSPDEMAEKIKTSSGMINKWEGDVCTPRASTLQKLAAAYEIPFEELGLVEIKNEPYEKKQPVERVMISLRILEKRAEEALGSGSIFEQTIKTKIIEAAQAATKLMAPLLYIDDGL